MYCLFPPYYGHYDVSVNTSFDKRESFEGAIRPTKFQMAHHILSDGPFPHYFIITMGITITCLFCLNLAEIVT